MQDFTYVKLSMTKGGSKYTFWWILSLRNRGSHELNKEMWFNITAGKLYSMPPCGFAHGVYRRCYGYAF